VPRAEVVAVDEWRGHSGLSGGYVPVSICYFSAPAPPVGGVCVCGNKGVSCSRCWLFVLVCVHALVSSLAVLLSMLSPLLRACPLDSRCAVVPCRAQGRLWRRLCGGRSALPSFRSGMAPAAPS
jgi:hypothetical protein